MNRVTKQKWIFIMVLAAVVILSLVLAAIMSKNLNKDTSQLRMELTKEYKALSDTEFEYSNDKGLKIYQSLCMSCHGDKGQGSGTNPVINMEAYDLTDTNELLKIVLFGKGNMPAHYAIPSEDMAQVLTYIRNNFGTMENPEITPLDIVIFKVDSLPK